MNLEVEIAGIRMKNPVATASGTFGYQYSDFFDLNLLGAIFPKSISLKPRPGNPPPRICEVYGGMINAIGLEGPGIDKFIEEELPIYLKFNTNIIPSVAGNTIEDYCKVVEKLDKIKEIAGLEINVSCPNVKSGLAFGTDAKETKKLVEQLKTITKYPLIVKLTPNVTNIVEVASAAYEGGADALSMINTLLGMHINIETQKPDISNKMGGYSGKPILPVAVRCVYQVYAALGDKIKIVGVGGINSGEDAIRHILAGATAVQIGTATFTNPLASINILEDIKKYMKRKQCNDINELIGKAHK